MSESRIHRLPPTLIDQIAAGEVVERPASVIKELVENAIDSAATRIEIEADGGGLARIVVSDDGCGMSFEEVALAVERHATSKIASLEDLLRVGSYGFRGEALPSIGSVSHLTVLTAARDDGEGSRVVVDGGRLTAHEPAGRPRGTTVTVLDLFANVPARRKFVRSADAERRRIVAVTTALALGRPDIAFRLTTNGRRSFDVAAAATARDRALDLLGGADNLGRMVPLALESRGVRVTGYLSTETFASRRNQYVFVRGRWVSDRVLTSSIGRAEAEVLRSGDRHPALVLWIDLDPEAVDVNVHPAKAEVRFRESNFVFQVVFGAVRQGLLEARGETAGEGRAGLGGRLLTGSSRSVASVPRRFEPDPAGSLFEPIAAVAATAVSEAGALPQRPESRVPAGHYLGQLHGTFLLVETGGGLVIFDQHVAHERVLFEKTLQRLGEGELPGQSLMEPIVLKPTPAERGVLETRAEDLARAGFGLAEMSGGDWGVTTVPELLRGNPLQVLRALLGAEDDDPSLASLPFLEALAARLACRAAIMAGDAVAPAEATRVLEDLERCRDPFSCPHGRPSWILLTPEELERRFGRR